MIVALAGAVLAGCSEDFMSEAVLQPEVPTVRLAVDHAETRASLDGVSVSWEAGDKISVNGTTYTLQGSESEGWYVDVAEAASYEAVYPASAGAVGRFVECFLPSSTIRPVRSMRRRI